MTIDTWARPIYRIGQFLGTLAVVTIALLTAADVFLRYFFNAAIFGAAEVANALLAVLVGAGLIVVAAQRLHICVDLFDAPLRKRFPKLYPRWIAGAELIGTAALAMLLGQHAMHTIDFGELTPVLEFPIGWVYALVALLVIMALAIRLSGWRDNSSDQEEEK